MSYYVMTCEGVYPSTMIGESPDLPGGAWMDGQPIQYDVPEPLVFSLNPEYPGKLCSMYDESILLMSSDLVGAIKTAGVDNIQCFRAVVRDLVNKKDYSNYQAVNILGLVSCADMEKSELMGTSDSALIDVDFHSLVIDESKAGGALLFRLAEKVSAIVVHEKVKENIEKKEIPNMVFYEPGEWSG